MPDQNPMTIADLIEIEAQGTPESFAAFLADPLAVIGQLDGPVLIPRELLDQDTP